MRARLVPAIFVLTLAIQPASARSDLPRLVGTVGPGFTIDLADASGEHVDRVTEGRYELLVHDLSAEHNFVLGSKSTGERYIDSGVEFVGDKTVTVDLAPGTYGYACSPHFDTMNGGLTVVAPRPKVLTGTVTSRGAKLSASTAAPGRYRIVVRDQSKKRSFRLVGPGVDRRTGKAFTGRKAWTLELRAGTYRYGAEPKLRGRLTVA